MDIKSRQMVRYYKIRKEILKLLGNKCKICSVKNNLQIDHINPNTKKFEISKSFNLSKRTLINEASKCQLLCVKCHSLKTIYDKGLKNAKLNHGTISSYRYCKCNECREAKRQYNIKYLINHKRVIISGKRVTIKI